MVMECATVTLMPDLRASFSKTRTSKTVVLQNSTFRPDSHCFSASAIVAAASLLLHETPILCDGHDDARSSRMEGLEFRRVKRDDSRLKNLTLTENVSRRLMTTPAIASAHIASSACAKALTRVNGGCDVAVVSRVREPSRMPWGRGEGMGGVP